MKLFLVNLLMILFFALQIFAQDGTIPSFQLEKNALQLTRSAQVGTPFDKVGRKFAILGEESGSFEAWAYPLKLFRSFNFSFFIGSSTRPIQAEEIVRYIDVTPEATTITYTYQSFTIRATYITPVDEAGAMILLDVNATEPLTIVCGFLPILQPMWPAGIGGQYASWNKELKAYLISEPTRKNHGLIGSPAASGISSTPAHMLSDAPNEFKIEIKDPDSVRGRFIPIYMAGGKGDRDKIINIYKRLQADPEKYYRQNIAYYQQLRDNTLRIETPVPQLDFAFEWAKVALDNMMVDNPDLGEGLVAGLGASGTSGRPGFGWYFGGDAFMNMLSFNSYGAFQTVRDALRFTQKWQRKDGKMAHELSQAAGYVDWWKDYPYGYIHGDTTPFYIVSMSDYYARSGDVQFIKESWNSLKRAYQWCLKTDANGDGLMDNKQAGLGASEYGELSGIETDVYLAAVWIRATQGMQVLARAIGDDKMAGQAEKDFRKAEKAYNRHFWVEDGGYYAYAFNADGQKVKEISPWQCVGLMWNLGTPERSRLSLQKVNSAELTTDWGVRLLSDKSKFYQPLGYNYGAVWPFVTGWVNMAQFQHHFSIQGYNTLISSARHTFDNELGSVSEVFSGTLNIWMAESVPHQGFSSTGITFPLVRGLFGLDGNAGDHAVSFAPQFPADWKQVKAINYKTGDAVFSFDYHRSNDKIDVDVKNRNGAGYSFTFSPVMGPGTEIKSVLVDNEVTTFDQISTAESVQPIVKIPLNGDSVHINILFEPTVELLPPSVKTRTGDRNRGLKVISIAKEDKNLEVNVEGLSGHTYSIGITHASKIISVQGASLEGNQLLIDIPGENNGEFSRHAVIVTTK